MRARSLSKRMARALLKKNGMPGATTPKQMASGDGPVRRRTPKSVEPPALVLMRDYFAVCAVISVVLCTVLFGTVMLLVRGIASTPAFVDRSLPERKR